MNILLVHNFYGSSAPSGENQVFEAEAALLGACGHEVETFTRHSDTIHRQGALGWMRAAAGVPWNPWAAATVRREVIRRKSEIVHVHNTFPLLSPAIFSAIGTRAARVLTLHNYRLFCPAAIPMRAGRVCTECMDGKSSWPAVQHGCYRGSRTATIPVAFGVGLHRMLGTWTKHVDAFIALTDFQREKMVAAGLPPGLVHVKPNFYPGDPPTGPWRERCNTAVFVGRLSAEKGVRGLIRAWLNWGPSAPELRIVGDGELRGELQRLAAESPQAPIRFLGQLSEEAAQAEIARARLLVLPSQWFEGFPMVIREAFAFGTPVAASAIGPLPSIVESGVSGILFQAGNPGALLDSVRNAWGAEGFLQKLGEGARKAFETLYTEDANYTTLMEIYRQATAVHQERKKAA
ncbi:MAG: glycosyltransferase family 4 protein [Gammaproteobacteria bacterium]